MIELKSGGASLGVDPALGGAVLHWHLGGEALFHPVSDANLIAQKLRPVGGYPLVPFSNRIGNGCFTFEGTTYQLDRNFASEPHAIHGNGWERVWDVASQSASELVLMLDHQPPRDPAGQWPFAYRATLTYRLAGDSLTIVMHIKNRDTRNQPVGMGFHPFFPRNRDLQLGFKAESVWISGDDNLPRKQVAVDGHWSFSPERPVGRDAIDNCYAGWDGTADITWPSQQRRIVIEGSPALRHFVLYTPPGLDFIACEAVSNMNNALNHPELPDNGTHVIVPGETFEVTTTYRVLSV